jgi:hypothetical protein
MTCGTPTWIQSVPVDGVLYARAYNGRGSRRFKTVAKQRAGRIVAAGTTKEVAFEPIEGAHNPNAAILSANCDIAVGPWFPHPAPRSNGAWFAAVHRARSSCAIVIWIGPPWSVVVCSLACT